MDEFLKKYHVSKLTQEEVENLNNSVSHQRIEFVSKSSLQKKPPGPWGFTGKFSYSFQVKRAPVLHKLLQKLEEKGSTAELISSIQHNINNKIS